MRFLPSRLAAALAALLFVSSVSLAEEATPVSAVALKNDKSLRRNAYVRAYEKARPSVVTIRVPRPNGGKDLIGTGVIFDDRGYIVTNFHVTNGQKQVNVRLFDGTELRGNVAVTEPSWDLAVVSIKTGTTLSPMRLGTADDLMVGEDVIAIGHPYGYQHTVSRGIISALGREITMPTGNTITGLIQTDASINPGNSGGPLLNIDGDLIGINTALREGAQGIAFAINIGMVKNVLSNHVRSQYVGGVEVSLRTATTTAQTTPATGTTNVTLGAGVGVPAGTNR